MSLQRRYANPEHQPDRPTFDRFVEAEVGSGQYSNASEVMREGLRLMERRKREDLAKLKWLRGAVREGLDQIDRGEDVEFGSVGELDRYIDEIANEVSCEPALNGKSVRIR